MFKQYIIWSATIRSSDILVSLPVILRHRGVPNLKPEEQAMSIVSERLGDLTEPIDLNSPNADLGTQEYRRRQTPAERRNEGRVCAHRSSRLANDVLPSPTHQCIYACQRVFRCCPSACSLQDLLSRKRQRDRYRRLNTGAIDDDFSQSFGSFSADAAQKGRLQVPGAVAHELRTILGCARCVSARCL